MNEMINRTPLFQEHKELKAKLTPFAGFEMPLSYGAVKEEYLAVRNASGVFDISHMAPIIIYADDKNTLIEFLEKLTCRSVRNLSENQVQYNALTNEEGGVIDDITIYCLSSLVYMLVVNASNRQAVIDHLLISNRESNCKIQPVENYCLIAVQGLKSDEFISKVKTIDLNTEGVYYYECATLSQHSIEQASVLSRTGYTGEDGFEILLEKTRGIALWKELIELGVRPCGLASRDLLRMEVFYPLYGNELSKDKTPLESGIHWLVDLDKDFLGKDKIQKQKADIQYKTRGFQLLEEGIPRKDYAVVSENDEEVGVVTSGSFSFQWNCGFGMAHLKSSYAKPGHSKLNDSKESQDLFVKIRDQKKKIRVLTKSPYHGSIKRRYVHQ